MEAEASKKMENRTQDSSSLSKLGRTSETTGKTKHISNQGRNRVRGKQSSQTMKKLKMMVAYLMTIMEE